MKLHILGICGTFMGGLAALARELGHDVTGSDVHAYPPMSTQLEALGITLREGYCAEHLQPAPDRVVVGNALSRGNPAVEYMLDAGLDYVSGPQWLGETVLRQRRVLAVAGTHGKTTTSSMLAWLLQAAGREPGFLIGGVPANFGVSARKGKGGQVHFPVDKSSVLQGVPESEPDPLFVVDKSSVLQGVPESEPDPLFVVEADEYDTAFFDKRSKFVHYRPQIVILNNLEFDHADIFPDLAAIERQFHHLVRTVPGNGRLIVNVNDANLARVLAQGCWTPVETFGIDVGDWQAHLLAADGSAFEVRHTGRLLGTVRWSQLGRHNVLNALAALAAAAASGEDAAVLLSALADFQGVARRLQRLGNISGIDVLDDFAHHPTAIATTLAGLRAQAGRGRILVALEPRSNTMRLGVHAQTLAPSLAAADDVVLLADPTLGWDTRAVIEALAGRGAAAADVDALLEHLLTRTLPGDTVVFMSNGSFGGAAQRFVAALRARG